MAQRDKVKELVGRGLNSYHTKALQQIHRIEKKNKEQNHKISILSNELDNDYLTKTEEGSVVSLEHSKEGMVYLDELQGNTLVNYCTDGSKELTLNGDIDVEGTFVTTTEGVDNGKVDVMCEGNTLVNLIKIDTSEYKTIGHASSNMLALGDASLFRNGIQYTIICEFSDIAGNARVCFNFNSGGSAPDIYVKPTQGLVKHTFTMPTEPTIKTNAQVRAYYFDQENSCKIKNLIILEGDWSNKEIPPYFEGMKSVGQDDENGHKIEILSKNKNLCTVSSYSGVRHNKIESNIPCKKNTVYTLTFKDESDLNQSGNRGITLITHKTKTDKNDHGNIYTYAMNEGGKEYTFRKSGFTFNTSDCCYISLTSNNMSSVPNLIIKEIQIEEGSQTSYSPQMFNKKEILINEPLRGLSNGIKDSFVKIGGKLFIERNTISIVYDGITNTMVRKWEQFDTDTIAIFGTSVLNIKKGDKFIICDKLRSDSLASLTNNPTKEFITNQNGGDNEIGIAISKSKLNGLTTNDINNYLKTNPISVVIALNSPTYEPLEINPELTCYNDITHISNNSIIPCTMKVKNSGYNAIIKPSTLYTIALDTNKSGTIGMNLGGVKGTTTNNVLTLTTPATLTDDSLRLYGKGIKGSKVRLLEGDKTNYIPRHFEGMKSSFEDKLQDDGTYKMEILSNNENLFDGEIEQGRWNYRIGGEFSKEKNNTGYRSKNIITLKPNTTYIIYGDFKGNGHIAMGTESNTITRTISMNIPNTITTSNKETMLAFYTVDVLGDEYIPSNIVIKKKTENIDYIPHKSNKIQFSSIEPLRAIGNVKDRFVFKDGKLMIERKCRKVLPDEFTYTRVHQPTYTDRFAIQFSINNCYKDHMLENVLSCNVLPYVKWGYDKDYDTISTHKSNDGVYINLDKNLWGYNGANGDSVLQRFIEEKQPILIVQTLEPYYEEIPFELQRIILEGYENGTLFFDTNIPPTSTITYAGETPIVKSVKLNKTEVLNNTNDINDNIVPYLMDMDYRVVCLQLQSENINDGVSMARLFGGAYEMLQRDIQSKRYSVDEYRHRLDAYLGANKITEDEYNKLGDMLNE